MQSEQTNVHVPYRDSKLTKLLMDAIGGTALCLMVACVTPALSFCDETTNTLMYATRAKRVVNKPRLQMDPNQAMLHSMRSEIELLRGENEYLRSIVARSWTLRSSLLLAISRQYLAMTLPKGMPHNVRMASDRAALCAVRAAS